MMEVVKMKKTLTTAFATALALGLVISPMESFAAKKSKRDSMSEGQKKDLRKRAREYCQKKYANGTAYLERVEIKSNGQVICWIRG
jgi:hypothetical protein